MGIGRHLLIFCLSLVLPPLLLGILRKSKAALQNRIGAPVWQPYFDIIRLFSKSETLSTSRSWIFRFAAPANFSIMLMLSFLLPWLSFSTEPGYSDLFLIVYFLGLSRFISVLAALDTGSSFGGFGASREVTVALLVEPALVLCLVALALSCGSSDLSFVFSAANSSHNWQSILWILAGSGIFLSAIVELSRLPVDDPCTHLELTMIHEAMILENSGPNLALTELAQMLKLTLLLGLSGQCLLHAVSFCLPHSELLQTIYSIAILFILVFLLAVLESLLVKLRWTKLPEFIAYPIALSLLCIFIAVSH